METNSSSAVCIASANNNHKSSTKLQQNDSAPLYATIIPSRKLRNQMHQLQTTKQPVQSLQPKPEISSKQVQNDDNASVYTSESASTSDSMELWSQEIPIWIKGEQRFISGVTEQTSCLEMIEALLIDEGIIKNDSNNNANSSSFKVNEYVITERWKRVEQILDGRTKILKIWREWGEEQPEVKFTLRRRSDSHHSTTQYQSNQIMGDKDSGRGSPTGSVNSAIVRRRRHRASRSSFAWITHGQTVHPKSQKSNIERLMKLILEQGEVIQTQLAKLRDREVEISTIEEERHKLREKEHGKNYLLETYLKALHDPEEKQESATGNSDSGVHTEETGTTAASPEAMAQHEDEISDTFNEQLLLKFPSNSTKKRRSKRESELLQEHESTKEFTNSLLEVNKECGETQDETSQDPLNDEVATQIEILEKLIVLNKHLQREEELMVRLGAKIKRYEADASGLTEQQVQDSLNRVNEQLDNNNLELQRMEEELKNSDDVLDVKSEVLKKLYDELEEAEVENRSWNNMEQTPDLLCDSYMGGIPPLPQFPNLMKLQHHDKEENLGLSREYLAENIYNISKMILKNNGGPSTSYQNSVDTTDFICHTPDQLQPMPLLNEMYPPAMKLQNKKIIQAQVHTIPSHHLNTDLPCNSASQTHLQYNEYNMLHNNHANGPAMYDNVVKASMNYLEIINQRIQKSNHNNLSNNFNSTIQAATNLKLGPKKLISKHVISSGNIYKPAKLEDSNSDTGLSSMGEVDTQLGTLV